MSITLWFIKCLWFQAYFVIKNLNYRIREFEIFTLKLPELCAHADPRAHYGLQPQRALIQGWLKCQLWNECYNWYNPWNIIWCWPWLRWYNLSIITDDCLTLMGYEGAQIRLQFQMSKKWDTCEIWQESTSSIKTGSCKLMGIVVNSAETYGHDHVFRIKIWFLILFLLPRNSLSKCVENTLRK